MDTTAQVLDPGRRVLFLDTDAMDAAETQGDGSPTNKAEASLLIQIVSAMAACGVSLRDICLVSPFRAQVHFIRISTMNGKIQRTLSMNIAVTKLSSRVQRISDTQGNYKDS